MDKNFLDQEQLNALLSQWKGKQVKITKREMEDTDEVSLDLEMVTSTTNSSMDDYISNQTLQLNGNGMIETTRNNYEEVPSNVFEIPVENNNLYEFDGKRIIISTSRGVYIIERE